MIVMDILDTHVASSMCIYSHRLGSINNQQLPLALGKASPHPCLGVVIPVSAPIAQLGNFLLA
jgi:hypothetical protein